MINKHSLKIGISFGTTSGIITTLGLMVGLNSGTHSQATIIGGILTIAIADSFSDALGIHVSEESEGKHTEREIWESTIYTFLAKFIFASIFIIPILFLELSIAIIVSIIFGLSLLSILSFLLSRKQNKKTWRVVLEHLIVALVVILLAHYIGNWVASLFG
jgi:VIT1/CCC1 family predicted Fe2+/Mn2+ transporter